MYHLNIEEAARELGIGMTKLKEHCRTLGIPRWPSRKLKSMDKLIESLNERAAIEPATKEVSSMPGEASRGWTCCSFTDGTKPDSVAALGNGSSECGVRVAKDPQSAAVFAL